LEERGRRGDGTYSLSEEVGDATTRRFIMQITEKKRECYEPFLIIIKEEVKKG